MDLNHLIKTVKQHPDYSGAGMILCHNGVVRATSRDGRQVTGLSVTVDHEGLARIIDEYKQYPGIIEVLVEIAEEKPLSVGDEVMFLVVAGDIRENVIAALTGALNAIKSTVTHKTEYYA